MKLTKLSILVTIPVALSSVIPFENTLIRANQIADFFDDIQRPLESCPQEFSKFLRRAETVANVALAEYGQKEQIENWPSNLDEALNYALVKSKVNLDGVFDQSLLDTKQKREVPFKEPRLNINRIVVPPKVKTTRKAIVTNKVTLRKTVKQTKVAPLKKKVTVKITKKLPKKVTVKITKKLPKKVTLKNTKKNTVRKTVKLTKKPSQVRKKNIVRKTNTLRKTVKLISPLITSKPETITTISETTITRKDPFHRVTVTETPRNTVTITSMHYTSETNTIRLVLKTIYTDIPQTNPAGIISMIKIPIGTTLLPISHFNIVKSSTIVNLQTLIGNSIIGPGIYTVTASNAAATVLSTAVITQVVPVPVSVSPSVLYFSSSFEVPVGSANSPQAQPPLVNGEALDEVLDTDNELRQNGFLSTDNARASENSSLHKRSTDVCDESGLGDTFRAILLSEGADDLHTMEAEHSGSSILYNILMNLHQLLGSESGSGAKELAEAFKGLLIKSTEESSVNISKFEDLTDENIKKLAIGIAKVAVNF